MVVQLYYFPSPNNLPYVNPAESAYNAIFFLDYFFRAS